MCVEKVGTIMTSRMTSNEQSDSTNYLKSIFEQSLAVLSEDKDSGKTDTQTGHLRRRSLPLHLEAVSLHKRALVDAAKALKTLWKISKPRLAKLQNRNMQFKRRYIAASA
jgi:hypothetical protein